MFLLALRTCCYFGPLPREVLSQWLRVPRGRARRQRAALRRSPFLTRSHGDVPVCAYMRRLQRSDADPHKAELNRQFPGQRHSVRAVVVAILVWAARTFWSMTRRSFRREIARKVSAGLPSGENIRKSELTAPTCESEFYECLPGSRLVRSAVSSSPVQHLTNWCSALGKRLRLLQSGFGQATSVAGPKPEKVWSRFSRFFVREFQTLLSGQKAAVNPK